MKVPGQRCQKTYGGWPAECKSRLDPISIRSNDHLDATILLVAEGLVGLRAVFQADAAVMMNDGSISPSPKVPFGLFFDRLVILDWTLLA